MDDWKPISTAPLDKPILLSFPEGAEPFSGVVEGWWHQVYAEPDTEADGWETPIGFIGTPTHWTELTRPI